MSSEDTGIRHPMWEGAPILLGDRVLVDDTEPNTSPYPDEVISGIHYDQYDGAASFDVAGQYWTVYMTESDAVSHESDPDDRFWIVGHSPNPFRTPAGAVVVEGGQS